MRSDPDMRAACAITVVVTSDVLAALLAAAREAHPREACGLLFEQNGVIEAFQPAANVHATPQTRFEIDPQALVDAHRAMRGGGRRLAGYFHSHPEGLPEPSETDQAMAACDGMIWAIAGRREVQFWRSGIDGFEPLPYRVTGA